MRTRLRINQRNFDVEAAPDTPLLWVLRDELGLTGTKYGCGKALCGACTVLVDGRPVRSCTLPHAASVGKEITTIEDIHSEVSRAVQSAWLEIEVAQCGYCQSGQILAATALLERNRSPSDVDIDRAMDGNICRCATYTRIRAAIHRAADRLS
ncbi:MAG: (2Fe-2S)-binding protein [Gammaproteobacteria bacterium]|nr:(2Fe-2S)-binding protein [Gammaproteobacteria bacterium]